MIGSDDVRARLGPSGVVLGYHGWGGSVTTAAPELEELGYSTLWLCGPVPGTGHPDPFDLDRVDAVLRATRGATVSTAVIPADAFGAAEVGRAYRRAEAEHPGRFVPGLGGAHGPRPLRTLNEYLDDLDAGADPVPAGSRLLSALGPKMLDLAAERTAGAVPVLVTPEYTAQARARTGPEAILVVEQFVVLDSDRARARDTARGPVGFQRDVEGGYSRHFRRLGFDDEDVAGLSDRMIDAVVACGDESVIAERVAQQHAAGADHVAVVVVTRERAPAPIREWRLLSQALVPA